MGLGSFLKKALKVVAIVAVVVAVAWVAAPYLGAFGAAIQSGITAVGEAIAAGAASLGEAFGLTATATAGTEAATTAAMIEAGTVGSAGAAMEASVLGTSALEGATLGAAAETAATVAPEVAAETIGAADGLANAGWGAGVNGAPGGMAGGANSAAGLTSQAGTLGQALPAVTSQGGMLQAAGAWVKDNPLVASTLLKGVGDFAGSLAGDPAQDEMRAKMEFEDWQRQRLSDSVIGGLQGSTLQYNKNAAPKVLRRMDGSLVYTNTGGVPGGALQRVMPGYGG